MPFGAIMGAVLEMQYMQTECKICGVRHGMVCPRGRDADWMLKRQQEKERGYPDWAVWKIVKQKEESGFYDKL